MKARLNRLVLAAVLLGFVAAHVMAARVLLHAYPYSWSWTELLVDYQGGFVKRGLLGEAAFRLQGVISPVRLVVDLVCGAYLLSSAGVILVLRLPLAFPGLLLLLSPAGWLFPLLNPAAYGRKDAFVVAACVASLIVAGRCARKTVALLVPMGIFLLAGLLVEIAWFYYPLVFAAVLVRWRAAPLRWRLGATAAAATYTLGCLALTLAAPRVDTAAIAESWHRIPYPADDTGALCCLNFGFAAAAGVARATLPNLGGYAAAAGLGALPLALLLIRCPPRPADPLTLSVVLAGLVSALFPLVVTSDWGRYIHLWLTLAFLWAWTVSGGVPATPDRDGSASGLLIRGALLALYASTWQVVHYQFPDRSALIPGALFRALGASGVTPLSN